MSLADASSGRRTSRSLVEPMLAARRSWLAMDSNPAALAWAQTLPGIALLHVALLALVAATGHLSLASLLFIAITLVALALLPAQRWTIFGLAGAAFFVLRPFRHDAMAEAAREVFVSPLFGDLGPTIVQVGLGALFLVLFLVALRAQRHWPKSLPAKRPLVALLLVLSASIGLGLAAERGGSVHSLLWAFVFFLSSSLFFVAYVFTDAKAGKTLPGVAAAGFARPFWGGPGVPFKGPSFLSRFEARTEEALAATRLRALKLIVWALVLTYAGHALDLVFHQQLELPMLRDLIIMHAQGPKESRAVGHVVLGVGFLSTILWMGAFSHTLVAIIRMAGFAIPRNMARPLTSRSLAEFWNRYVFYFKEVLVDFFFYPAFARYFKTNIALRTAFATFCAACLGNVLFSVVAQANLFFEIGILAVARHFESYAFYALLLALALIASQLRKAKPKPEHGWLRYDVLPRVWVIGVFMFLLIFADESGAVRLVHRLDFAAWLLFLR